MREFNDLHHDLEQDQDEEEQEQEEAISLCDFPLDDTTKEIPITSTHAQRPSSESAEFFEFFSDASSEMCSAEDIIFCGKLIPSKEQYFPLTQTLIKARSSEEGQQRHSIRRRCESLSGLQISSVSRTNSFKDNNALMRNSRSLDYRKLQRFSSSKRSSPESDFERSSSIKSVGKGDVMAKKATTKPRWYVLMFGMVKPPIEMELSDIKSRQFRRNSSITMFPTFDSEGKKVPVNQSFISKSSGRLLRVLSCKDVTNVGVATSLCVPQV